MQKGEIKPEPEEPSMTKPGASEQFWTYWEMIGQSWKSQIKSKPVSLEMLQKLFCWQFSHLLIDINKKYSWYKAGTAGIQLSLDFIGLQKYF